MQGSSLHLIVQSPHSCRKEQKIPICINLETRWFLIFPSWLHRVRILNFWALDFLFCQNNISLCVFISRLLIMRLFSIQKQYFFSLHAHDDIFSIFSTERLHSKLQEVILFRQLQQSATQGTKTCWRFYLKHKSSEWKKVNSGHVKSSSMVSTYLGRF